MSCAAPDHLQPLLKTLLKTQGKCLLAKHFGATGNGYCLHGNFPILV